MNILHSNIVQISGLCKKHKVDKLYAFGSVGTEQFNDQSDIDLIVKFRNIDLLEYADNYFDLKFSLENLFKKDVDLLEDQAISNPYLRKSIDATKMLVYG